MRTIVFTDIEGHAEMMQRLGDENGRSVLREHERIIRSALVAHGGREVVGRALDRDSTDPRQLNRARALAYTVAAQDPTPTGLAAAADESAALETHDPRTNLCGFVLIVGDVDCGGTGRADHPDDLVGDAELSVGVEGGQRFVE